MLKRLAVPLVALLVLTACGSSGEPEGFDEQPVRISEELQSALDTDTEFLPVVERNFLEGCLLADTPRITSNDLASSCQQCQPDSGFDGKSRRRKYQKDRSEYQI